MCSLKCSDICTLFLSVVVDVSLLWICLHVCYLSVATKTDYQKLECSKYHRFIFLNVGGQKSKLLPS